MKIRIISGTVLVALLIGVIVLQGYYPPVLTLLLSLLGAMAVYEVLYVTALNKNKIMVGLGAALSLVAPFVIMGIVPIKIASVYTVYALLTFALGLKFNKTLSVNSVISAIIFPVIISYAFSSIGVVTQSGKCGILYLILLFCFSAVSDTGAYFTGVFFGKHKMAPVISPKKTWEGFVGGMIISVIATYLACIIYQNTVAVSVDVLCLVIASPVFAAVGVLGDLSASFIKRECGIKDYSNLIPGHGGILDRFDSILMISPLFMAYLQII